MRIITVDLGNTRAKFGYFPGLADSYPVPTATFADTPGRFGALTDWLDQRVDGSDPPISEPIAWYAARTGNFPWPEFRQRLAVIRPRDRFEEISYRSIPMILDIESPEKAGLDRLLAAFAALCWRRLPENTVRFENCSRFLVVDAGTATTIDLVGGDDQFAGGAIFPGLNALSESLAGISSRLPRISSNDISFAVYPGKNTEEALAAGMYWGTVGAIRQFHAIVRDSLLDADLPSRVPVFLAGGDGEHLYNGLSLFLESDLLISLPELILSGIALTARSFGAK